MLKFINTFLNFLFYIFIYLPTLCQLSRLCIINLMMILINNLARLLKEAVAANFDILSWHICLYKLSKIMNILNHDVIFESENPCGSSF